MYTKGQGSLNSQNPRLGDLPPGVFLSTETLHGARTHCRSPLGRQWSRARGTSNRTRKSLPHLNRSPGPCGHVAALTAVHTDGRKIKRRRLTTGASHRGALKGSDRALAVQASHHPRQKAPPMTTVKYVSQKAAIPQWMRLSRGCLGAILASALRGIARSLE